MQTIQISLSQKKLLQNFKETRRQSEQLCKPLKLEDYVVQPVDFVSPPKWNLAHVSWFFETFILKAHKPNYKEFHEDFAYFFNSYYESVGKRTLRAQRGNMTRPSTEEVYAYRAYVDQAIEEFLSQEELSPELLSVFELGIHHEQQHQELLLTDIKYILAHNPLFPPYLENSKGIKHQRNQEQAAPKGLKVEEGLYSIGYEGEGFHFDNEKGQHQVFLPAFQISDSLISNREYLEFMQDGGYQDFRHWLSPAWEWVKSEAIDSPLYWHNIEGVWHSYTLQGLQELYLQAPVTHISLYEADAFAAWRGKRLATEFEWEVACKIFNPQIPASANFLESGHLSPQREVEKASFYGNVWEWTNSAYLAYPHFDKAPGALGEYNGKFMINQMVLRGGSCASPKNHIRPSYRNFFHPHERWQFTGIRLAEYL